MPGHWDTIIETALDGRATPKQQQKIKALLCTSPAFQREWAASKHIHDLLRAGIPPRLQVPADFHAQIIQRLRPEFGAVGAGTGKKHFARAAKLAAIIQGKSRGSGNMKIRGASVVSLRQYFKELGEKRFKEMGKKLSPKLRKVLLATRAEDWVDAQEQAALYCCAAEALYPGCKDNVFKLNLVVAEKSYSSEYEILLKVEDLDAMLDQTRNVWSFHFQEGEPELVDRHPNGVTLLVTQAPDLPEAVLESIKAHVMVLVAGAGRKHIKIKVDKRNAQAWKWIITWKGSM